jgi:hypothetical protein
MSYSGTFKDLIYTTRVLESGYQRNSGSQCIPFRLLLLYKPFHSSKNHVIYSELDMLISRDCLPFHSSPRLLGLLPNLLPLVLKQEAETG